PQAGGAEYGIPDTGDLAADLKLVLRATVDELSGAGTPSLRDGQANHRAAPGGCAPAPRPRCTSLREVPTTRTASGW
ncbi:hypothetical protein ABZV69_35025, partial [Streptomyces microflavus]